MLLRFIAVVAIAASPFLSACALPHPSGSTTDDGDSAAETMMSDAVAMDGSDGFTPDRESVDAPDIVEEDASAMDMVSTDRALDVVADETAALDTQNEHAPPPDTGRDVPITCDSGMTACSGACTDLSTDTSNCGACGTACRFDHASALCASGSCALGLCAAGYYDCDGDASNGCESATVCAYASCGSLPAGSPSGAYMIAGPNGPWTAYCDTSDPTGAWTLVLKADGTQPTFQYDAMAWTDGSTLNVTSTDLSHTEAKFDGFNVMAFTAVRIDFVDPTDNMTRSIHFAASGSSMTAMFNGGFSAVSVGVSTWESLMASASMQANCNREGFNAQPDSGGGGSRVRIGILGNEQNDCSSPNSRIGIGGQGVTASTCNPSGADSNAAGNVAGCTASAGNRNVEVFAYLFVR